MTTSQNLQAQNERTQLEQVQLTEDERKLADRMKERRSVRRGTQSRLIRQLRSTSLIIPFL